MNRRPFLRVFEMRSQSNRIAIVLSLALHACLAVALLWWWRSPTETRRVQSSLTLVDIAATSSARAPRDRLPGKTLSLVEKPSQPRARPQTASSTTASTDAGCGITGALQRALSEEPGAIEELSAVPAEQRSVAGAIVLWSADPAAARPQLPLAYAAIRRQLSEARPECLDAAITGPDLLYLDGTGSGMALAFGSGQWRWRDFLFMLDETCEAICGSVRSSS